MAEDIVASHLPRWPEIRALNSVDRFKEARYAQAAINNSSSTRAKSDAGNEPSRWR
jgi:hypothetical protein